MNQLNLRFSQKKYGDRDKKFIPTSPHYKNTRIDTRFNHCYHSTHWNDWLWFISNRLSQFLPSNNRRSFRPVHVLLSRFYPYFIQILSWSYPDFILILSRFFKKILYPDFIQILFKFYQDFLETHFIQILSRFYDDFIWIKLG